MNEIEIVDNPNKYVKYKVSPLSIKEERFVNKYLETGDEIEAYKYARFRGGDAKAGAYRVLKKPAVRAVLEQRMDALRKQSIASSNEVMEFLSKVMRGEVKDQFELDAPLSERIKASQELLKRTFDIEYRERQLIAEEGRDTAQVTVSIDWGR